MQPSPELVSMAHPITAMVLLVGVLIAAAVADVRTGKVRNTLTYAAVLAGFALAAIGGWFAGGLSGMAMELNGSLIACVVAVVGFALIFAMGGLGGGDVKLMAAVGAISGDWRIVFATTVYAFVIGAVMAVGIMVGKGIVRETAQRIFVAVLLGGPSASPNASTAAEENVEQGGGVPFAVAIALGGCVAGVELLLGVRTPWAGFVG
ncbi:MAG: A24 family peptidase [Phycisphaeraceae bacterium]